MLQEMLSGVELTEERDRVKWELDKKGKFTTSSLYRAITDGGVTIIRSQQIGKASLPRESSYGCYFMTGFHWQSN